jgi:hypothetical protein
MKIERGRERGGKRGKGRAAVTLYAIVLNSLGFYVGL